MLLYLRRNSPEYGSFRMMAQILIEENDDMAQLWCLVCRAAANDICSNALQGANPRLLQHAILLGAFQYLDKLGIHVRRTNGMLIIDGRQVWYDARSNEWRQTDRCSH